METYRTGGKGQQTNLRKLQYLSDWVAPRVCAATFSTLWNRWTTARRFQKRNLDCNRCVLGCGGEAEDSLEHYSRCKVVRAVAGTILKIGTDEDDTKDWFFLNGKCSVEGEDLACLALLHYASYNATNDYRRNGIRDPERARDAMVQHLRNAVRGHSASTKLLDNRWQKDSTGSERRSKRLRVS